MKKKFLLKQTDIQELVPGMGASLVTDRITVEGNKVGFMYRQKPDNEIDSGWRFFSGVNEDDEYVDDPDNTSVQDVNTIANYDESIIPFLQSPTGSVFERNEKGKWTAVDDFVIPD